MPTTWSAASPKSVTAWLLELAPFSPAWRDIIDSRNAGARAILDWLCAKEIADLRSENQNLKLAASQQAQNNYLVNALRPIAQPA